jgi:hypothetical protein
VNKELVADVLSIGVDAVLIAGCEDDHPVVVWDVLKYFNKGFRDGNCMGGIELFKDVPMVQNDSPGSRNRNQTI